MACIVLSWIVKATDKFLFKLLLVDHLSLFLEATLVNDGHECYFACEKDKRDIAEEDEQEQALEKDWEDTLLLFDVVENARIDIVLAEIANRDAAQVSVGAHREQKSDSDRGHDLLPGWTRHTRVDGEQGNYKSLRGYGDIQAVYNALEGALLGCMS